MRHHYHVGTGFYAFSERFEVSALIRSERTFIAYYTAVCITVAAITWAAIAELYSDLYNGSRLNEGQYPGYEIG